MDLPFLSQCLYLVTCLCVNFPFKKRHEYHRLASIDRLFNLRICHHSSEHAFQYVKAIRCGDIQKAQAIQEAETALDAKKLGKDIPNTDEFISKREEIMEEILNAK